MYTKWTDNLPEPRDKSDFEKQIMGSKSVLDRLNEILQSEVAALDRSEVNMKTFDTPNWAYIQAFKNGYRAAFNLIQMLISLDDQTVAVAADLTTDAIRTK